MTTCRGCGGPVPRSTLPVDVCSYECKIATDGPGVPDDPGRIAARLTADANDDRKSPAPTAANGASQAHTETDALPPFAVAADYHACTVALHFDTDVVPALCRHPLFAPVADQIHARAADVEEWIEGQIRDDRDRQITGGLL